MRFYVGYRDFHQRAKVVKYLDGQLGELEARFDLREHSPAGFEWGYAGSGPAQLALGILADLLDNDALACRLYQDFKFEVVGRLCSEFWLMTADGVYDWVVQTLGARDEMIDLAAPAVPKEESNG